MKNHSILILTSLAFASVLSLFSCKKVEMTGSEDEPYAFKAGQKVRITVNAPSDADDADSRVYSAYDSGVNGLQFYWETGDQIKVKVGGDSARFTLVPSCAGTPAGTFEGIMPASGTTFTVQFPYDYVTETDLATQTYEAGGLPKNKMMFSAINCDPSEVAELQPLYAGLKLNLLLMNSGDNLKVGRIVVADTLTKQTFTLNCPSGGIALNKSTAVPFYLVVPEGMYDSKAGTRVLNWMFDVRIYDELDYPINCLKKRSDDVDFETGKILVMEYGHLEKDAFSVSTNYKLNFAKGNLTYDGTKWGFENTQYAYPTKSDPHHIGHFYWMDSTHVASAYANDYTKLSMTTADELFCAVNTKDPFQVDKKSYAAMNKIQWEHLLTVRDKANQLFRTKVTVCGVANCLVIAPDNYPPSTIKSSYDAFEWASAEAEGLVCLPPTGRRDKDGIHSDGSGYYWISDCDKSTGADAETPYCLDITSDKQPIVKQSRANGYPIRLAYHQ